MKRSILILIACLICAFAYSQTDTTTHSDEQAARLAARKRDVIPLEKSVKNDVPASDGITAEDKSIILQTMNLAKETLFKSSNGNTTEQNVAIINNLQYAMSLINSKIIAADVKPVVKETAEKNKK